jgi:hypothetical protein
MNSCAATRNNGIPAMTKPTKTKQEAEQDVIEAARQVLTQFEIEFQAGHGVGGARHARIVLQLQINELDAMI